MNLIKLFLDHEVRLVENLPPLVFRLSGMIPILKTPRGSVRWAQKKRFAGTKAIIKARKIATSPQAGHVRAALPH